MVKQEYLSDWVSRAQEIAHLGIWDQNPISDELWWSDETFRILGLEPQSIDPDFDAFLQLVYPEDRATIVEQTELSLESDDHSYNVDYRIIWADKSEHMIHEEALVERDEKGIPTKITGILQDITERKRMERTLIRSERLRVASELSAGMCHNLNNILSGISMPAQMLKRVTKDPESLHDVELIVSSSQRAIDLVRQLHLSVCGQTGKSPYAVDLNEALEQTLQLTQGYWEQQPHTRGIDIDVRAELGEILAICGTESGVQEIIANLIFNAVDAMPEGGDIGIRTQIEDEFVRLSFSDTGIGMDEETSRKVFEPFFTTKMDIGAGLGLSSLHGMLTHWGGKAEVESTPGEGTTFTLYFPVWQEE